MLNTGTEDPTRAVLVATRAEKFVGKTAVDTVAVRLGAVMSAVMVWMGVRAGWSTATFAAINVALACVWLVFVFAIGEEHARRSAALPLQTEPSRGNEPSAA